MMMMMMAKPQSYQIINIFTKYSIMTCLAERICVLGQCYLTHGQVHVVSLSQSSQPVQTPALIIALQTLDKACAPGRRRNTDQVLV